MSKSPALTAYLCGPITDLPNQNLGGFQTARREVELKGYRTIMPHDLFIGIDTSDYEHNDYMRRCIQAMLTTDIIVLLPGWEQSLGAKKEITVGNLLNIPTIRIAKLNSITSYSKKRNKIWETINAFEHWFNNKFGWFLSPAKNYKNQTIKR